MKRVSKAKIKKEKRDHIESVRQELSGLRASMESACSLFNHSADPEILEASILQFRALQSKYGCALRSMKALYAAAP